MQDLTFGEQVKIILSRRGMTIKGLAEMIEDKTGKKMSRQNLTQRLGRDNFQEQDMRMIAEILGCPFELNIMGEETAAEAEPTPSGETAQTGPAPSRAAAAAEPELEEGERDMTVGEFLDAVEGVQEAPSEETPVSEETVQEEIVQEKTVPEGPSKEEQEEALEEIMQEEFSESSQEELSEGEINPYTGKEYETNSVRMHPKRIGYVQVYDQAKHEWVDMTEWAFLGYEERKKVLMGDNYVPPIYLD